MNPESTPPTDASLPTVDFALLAKSAWRKLQRPLFAAIFNVLMAACVMLALLNNLTGRDGQMVLDFVLAIAAGTTAQLVGKVRA